MNYQISRILNDKGKVVVILLLIALPSLEILQYLFYKQTLGMEFPNKNFGTFLAASSMGHILQSLYLWFLPLYLLVISGIDSIEDKRSGNIYPLLVRLGKKKYLRLKLSFSFSICFLIIAVGLLINLGICQIVFANGEYMPYDPNYLPNSKLFQLSYSNPFLANILFIFVASLLGGLIGALGTALSIAIASSKIVFPLTFALWLFPIILKNSLVIVVQPFSEYDFSQLLPKFIGSIITYLLIISFVYIWEVRIVKV